MPPWTRRVEHSAARRIMDWCDALLPGTPVDVVEWVGADNRQPPHVLAVSFPGVDRRPLILPMKSAAVARHNLAQALEGTRT